MEGPSRWLKKGAWTAEEDALLRQCIDKYGEGKWNKIPLRAASRKQVYIPPYKSNFVPSVMIQYELMSQSYKCMDRWALIAGRLPGRTPNDVKNYWNTNLCKKQEPCCKSKVSNIAITCSNTTVSQKIDVLKPSPRSFPINIVNGCSGLNALPMNDLGEVANNDEEKDKFVNDLIVGEGMWWDSLLEESPMTDIMGPKYPATEQGEASTDSSLFHSISFTFDIDELWSMLDIDTGETV
ncbi:unnamed protein product [Eruca vesicaria subsp. sativa]|uniref:Uncharacterized protein n=1 Tax=Eruca vesicaria subsp. sativa TaxID=29727 RepID=A0ABC8JJN3_ERUVS|nr:unnamed protein product [Eruca vesicaria subsp. sativa]